MRVQVDREVCNGAGNCVLTVPEVFDQDDDDGLVTLLPAEPPPAPHALLGDRGDQQFENVLCGLARPGVSCG